MSPEEVRAWLRVIRDAVLYISATVMLGTVIGLYIVRDEDPNVTLLAAAGFFFGLAPALRADEWLLRGGKNGNGNASKGDPSG